MRPLASVVLALSLLAPGLSAQVASPPPPTRDSVTVVAGEEYEASGLFKTFMGGGYRNLWITPIRVPGAYLALWGGGGAPALLAAASAMTGGGPGVALAMLAVILGMGGVLIERWLFFAEAKHTVMLYYGTPAA